MNDHDYNQNPEPAHSGMETAAIILGILALIGSTCFYLSIPCAAIGILLALLSRGRKEHYVHPVQKPVFASLLPVWY